MMFGLDRELNLFFRTEPPFWERRTIFGKKSMDIFSSLTDIFTVFDARFASLKERKHLDFRGVLR